MPTLILTPRFTEDSQALWRAAIQLGWNVERLTNWRVNDRLLSLPEPVLYLEALMARSIAAKFGITLSEVPLTWLPQLPEEYRQRWVYLTTLAEARKLQEPAFIKPPNDKSFTARVYFGSELPEDFLNETPVLVAEIVYWEKEFRTFILERKLQTFSVYLRNGELQRETGFQHSDREESELREFVAQLLEDSRVELPRSACLDVGVIRDRGWAVIEQNAVWGAGIYGCDPVEVLRVFQPD
ncbi:MAG: ATP-grasp domain-containing protein [Cyanobacteria bacterium SBLK]|nr:ATP-grasp domain-containing protein [Cyanobacteria bacterium SBLK]